MSWVSSNTKIQGTSAAAQEYVRPSDWPVLPTVIDGNQVFYGLHAVFDHDSNFIALSAEGAYTVDWGDGSTPENISSGVQANHIYDYSSVTSPVTARGYKTVVVTVTPQSGNLTGLNLSKKHTQAGLPSYSTGWLELAIGGSFSISSLVIGATSPVYHRLLERVVCIFGTSAVTYMDNMFYNCYSLQSVPLFVTSSVTNMGGMFYSCYSLQSVPLFVTSAVTNMSSMFYNCYSLQTVPLFVTSSVTNMSSMFYACYSLQSVPLFVTSSVTNMGGMFFACYSLQSVPLFVTSAVTDMSNMFRGCSSLQSVPLFVTSAVRDMSGMFYACFSLQSVPLFVTSLVTNMSNMFYACYSLQSVPLFVTSSVTNMGGMFYNCYSLQSVPLFVTSAVTAMNGMFYSCYSLQSVPLFVTSSVTDMGGMFYYCYSLSKILMSTINVTLSVASCALSRTAIVALFNNLATTTGKTLTITGNWGVANLTADDRLIATNKGWTLVEA